MASSTSAASATPQAKTLLDVMHEAPQLLISVLSCGGIQQADHVSRSKALNILRLVSKGASVTVVKALHRVHLNISGDLSGRTPDSALRRISTLHPHLTHLQATMTYMKGYPTHGENSNTNQLKEFLEALSLPLKSVTHLQLTAKTYTSLSCTLIALIQLPTVIFNTLIKNLPMEAEPISEALKCFWRSSSATADLLATACPKLTHLTVNCEVAAASLQFLGTNCHITSLQLLDNRHTNGADYLRSLLTHFPNVTHLTMLFVLSHSTRVSLLAVLSASPNLTHLTLGRGSMMFVDEWLLLPAGLREIRFGVTSQAKRVEWSEVYINLSDLLGYSEDVDSMLGLELGTLRSSVHNATQLVATKEKPADAWGCRHVSD